MFTDIYAIQTIYLNWCFEQTMIGQSNMANNQATNSSINSKQNGVDDRSRPVLIGVGGGTASGKVNSDYECVGL